MNILDLIEAINSGGDYYHPNTVGILSTAFIIFSYKSKTVLI
jgi:hypothetical protein